MNYSIIALQSIIPNCEFAWGDPYTYETLTWLDKRLKPTKQEWEAEKARLIAYQPKQDCKNKAKELLQNSDWTEIPSVVQQLENSIEWKNYRIAVRQYIINPVEDPIFPQEPQTKWKA